MCLDVGKGRRILTKSTLELSATYLATLPMTKQEKREQL